MSIRCVIAALALVSHLAFATSFTYEVLGTFGRENLEGLRFNNAGWVVGMAYNDFYTGIRPFLWRPNEGFIDRLDNGFRPIDVNDAGDVLSGGPGMYAVGPVEGPWTYLEVNSTDARRLNTRGQILGYSLATVYTPGVGWVEIGSLDGRVNYPRDMNNMGQVVGALEKGDRSLKAYLYTEGIELIDIAPGSLRAGASAINDAGYVAGYIQASDSTPEYSVFLYTPQGELRNLNISGGPVAINNRDWILGSTYRESHPFLYIPGEGSLDLRSMLKPGIETDFFLPYDVNDRGQILAAVYLDENVRTIVLTPVEETVPESRTFVLTAVGLTVVILWRRKLRGIIEVTAV